MMFQCADLRQEIYCMKTQLEELHNNCVLQTLQLSLEAAQWQSSPHQKSLEGISWVFQTYHQAFRLNYARRLAASDPKMSHVKETFFSSYNTASASTAEEDLEEFLGRTPTSSLIETDRASSFSTPQLTYRDFLIIPKRSWSPPKFLKCRRRLERRFSGDYAELTSNFNQRCRMCELRLRRRKSFNEESLEAAEWQGMQLSTLRNSLNQNTASSLESRFYRRCRSATTVEDLEDINNSNTKHEVVRKHSLSSLRFSSGEIWPETITSLITGKQTLIDRFLLFGYLDSLLCERRHESEAAVNALSKKRFRNLRLWSAGISIPRPDKPWGGEDAFFACDQGNFVGVADGVGEWGELGCNPRQFAEELMSGARQEALKLKLNSSDNAYSQLKNAPASLRARHVLGSGFHVTRSFGASTSIVAGLNVEGTSLGIANVGDSSCLVLRRESKRPRNFVAFRRTKEQQHFFNCPYQLSRIPCEEDLPGLMSQGMHTFVRALRNFTVSFEGDTPDMADLYDVKVQEGDVVILATDGVFDNLFDQEIASLVSLAISPYEAKVIQSTISPFEFTAHPSSIMPPEFSGTYGAATPPQNLAKAIAEAAFYRSIDPKARTPFSNHSRRAGGYFQGGKTDDITVVVAWII